MGWRCEKREKKGRKWTLTFRIHIISTESLHFNYLLQCLCSGYIKLQEGLQHRVVSVLHWKFIETCGYTNAQKDNHIQITQDVCQGVSSLSASGFTVGLEVDEMSTEKMMLARRKRAGEGSGITYSPLLSRLWAQQWNPSRSSFSSSFWNAEIKAPWFVL